MDIRIIQLRARSEELRFSGLYKRVAGNVTIVGKPGMGEEEISRKLSRLGMQHPIPETLARFLHKINGRPVGYFRGRMREGVEQNRERAGKVMGGLRISGKKGQRVYINRATVRGGGMGLREVVHHEKFHTLPVIGRSEIAAHFAGGLMREKGKLHPGIGFKRIGHLGGIRPDRFGIEAGVATAGVAGAALGAKRIAKGRHDRA